MIPSDASKENSRKHLVSALRQHLHNDQWSEVADQILKGNRSALSQAITWSESTLPQHRNFTQKIIEKVLPFTGRSFRLGMTGVPGVGKSTLIEALGMQWIQQGHRVAVLAIDPSSPITQGSILGDKTRMEQLSMNPNAFVRPSASANELGGVAAHTHEAILLCEAAGFDRIIVETVGVGQSETAVHHMTDCFLLLMLAGAGDQLQGIKRGIMEMCDLLAITKADGDNHRKAELAKAEYQNALHLFPERPDAWSTPVVTLSAIEKKGIDLLVEELNRFESWSKSRQWNIRRSGQLTWQFETELLRQLKNKMSGLPLIQEVEKKIIHQEIGISEAVQQLLAAIVMDTGNTP
jgi:LAO/AO transport system kinase